MKYFDLKIPSLLHFLLHKDLFSACSLISYFIVQIGNEFFFVSPVFDLFERKKRVLLFKGSKEGG